jgi:flagella basal body P-ring formation protein FlgA
VGREEVVAAVESALAPRVEGDASLRVTAVGLPSTVPAGEVTLEVREPMGPLARASTVGVDVLVDGRKVGRAWARVEVQREREVVVVARAARKGRVLEADDLEVRPATPASAARGVTDPAGLVGKRLTRNLSGGAVVSAADVEEPPAVEKGDTVRLVVRVGGVTAAAQGRGREKGCIGQTLRAENLGSGRVVQGTLREAGVVEIPMDFGR